MRNKALCILERMASVGRSLHFEGLSILAHRAFTCAFEAPSPRDSPGSWQPADTGIVQPCSPAPPVLGASGFVQGRGAPLVVPASEFAGLRNDMYTDMPGFGCVSVSCLCVCFSLSLSLCISVMLQACSGELMSHNTYANIVKNKSNIDYCICLLYTSPSPRDGLLSRMPSSA